MSKCISSHGEYSSHENDEFHTCKWCGMFDEAVVLKKLEAAEAAIERVRERHREEYHECIECSFEPIPDVGFRGVSVPYPCPTIRALEGDE